MARHFPRFLFSNPKNTKSEGPLIISTIPPLIICKVHLNESKEVYHDSSFCEKSGPVTVEFLKLLAQKTDGNSFGKEVRNTVTAMATWLSEQMQKGEILA